MRNLIILGAREHAKVLAVTVEDALRSEWSVEGFWDDNLALKGTKLLGRPIFGPISELENQFNQKGLVGALVGISNNHMSLRRKFFEKIRRIGFLTPRIISPDAVVHRTAEVGEGTLVCPGTVVHAFAKVGANCVLYSNSTVEHECVLEDHVYLGPGVNFCADVHVGEGTFIGTGASIICRRIGRDVVVAAGAVVVDDLPDGVVAMGMPARITRVRSPEEREQSFPFRKHDS